MKRSTRMMLMSGGRKDDRRYDREPEDKLRDRRGREHYDNGRYAPRSEMMEPEDRAIVATLMGALPHATMVACG